MCSPHVTYAFDLQSSLLPSYHTSPISKFLSLLIHLSLTYEISKLPLPLVNLALAETLPKGTKGNYLSHLIIDHIITIYHKDFMKQIKIHFLLFIPQMASHSCSFGH
jgi:predicted peptidase